MLGSIRLYTFFVLLVLCCPAFADRDAHAGSHAPIGVMGDHLHKAGEWMLSLRTMSMSMSGNLKGSAKLSPNQIVTREANRFAGMPMMPPTLRVAPIDMTTRMQMLGMMYAPTNNITLMAMLNYVEKDMVL